MAFAVEVSYDEFLKLIPEIHGKNVEVYLLDPVEVVIRRQDYVDLWQDGCCSGETLTDNIKAPVKEIRRLGKVIKCIPLDGVEFEMITTGYGSRCYGEEDYQTMEDQDEIMKELCFYDIVKTRLSGVPVSRDDVDVLWTDFTEAATYKETTDYHAASLRDYFNGNVLIVNREKAANVIKAAYMEARYNPGYQFCRRMIEKKSKEAFE